MVLDLFRERIRQPGHSPGLHPNVQVVPLCIGCADLLWIGFAFDPHLASADSSGGAVAPLAFQRGAIVLHNDRAKVSLVAVRRRYRDRRRAIDGTSLESASV